MPHIVQRGLLGMYISIRTTAQSQSIDGGRKNSISVPVHRFKDLLRLQIVTASYVAELIEASESMMLLYQSSDNFQLIVCSGGQADAEAVKLLTIFFCIFSLWGSESFQRGMQ